MSKKDNSKLYKSIKYRIFPDERQKEILNRYFGVRRYVYNYLTNLIFNTNYLKENEDSKFSISTITFRDLIRKEGSEWIRGNNGKGFSKDPNVGQINVTVVENACLQFINAYNMYKENVKKCLKDDDMKNIDKYRPKIKTKKESSFSCTFGRKDERTFKIIDGMLNTNISRFYGRQTFKTKKSINIDSKCIKQVTFSKSKSGKYYMGIIYETQVYKPVFEKGSKVGMDLGIKTAAVNFDGKDVFTFELPEYVSKLKSKRDKINSKVSKAKNNSKNKLKLSKRKIKAEARAVNSRNNWQDHLVIQLCKKYEIIIIDDMPKRGEGLSNHNGKKMTIAPGRFIFRLKLKALEYGNTIFILPKGTKSTQTCSSCGNVKKKHLKLKDRVYKCDICPLEMDRDENSARFIYNFPYQNYI